MEKSPSKHNLEHTDRFSELVKNGKGETESLHQKKLRVGFFEPISDF